MREDNWFAKWLLAANIEDMTTGLWACDLIEYTEAQLIEYHNRLVNRNEPQILRVKPCKP